MLGQFTLFAGFLSLATALPFTRDIPLGTSFGIPGVPTEFDYIVVGGGCAGLTIAGRLAENSSISVAVIEAGSFYQISNGNLSEVPATDIEYIGKARTDWQPAIDWGFITTPQRVSDLLGDSCLNS